MEGTLSIMAQGFNTAMVLLIAYGLFVRRTPRLHVRAMISAFAGDVVNVLFVEVLARSKNPNHSGAVEQGVSALLGNGSPLLVFHVVVSLLFLLGYAVALFTGLRLLKKGVGRRLHKWNAGTFIVMRLLSYATSFFV